tara:strand:- start:301 stop:477 length:177 start_codon:yes stop_codon:yes gene_type:complete
MKDKVNPFDYDEIYRLPIIVTERDIQMDRIYEEFYNDDYMKKYKEKKNKALGIDNYNY